MSTTAFEQYGLGILWCHIKKYTRGITQDDYVSKSPVPSITSGQPAMAFLQGGN